MPEDIPIWYNLFSSRGRFSSDWQPSAAVDCPSVHVGQGRKRKMDPTYELKMRKREHYPTWLRRQEKYEEKFLPSIALISQHHPSTTASTKNGTFPSTDKHNRETRKDSRDSSTTLHASSSGALYGTWCQTVTMYSTHVHQMPSWCLTKLDSVFLGKRKLMIRCARHRS